MTDLAAPDITDPLPDEASDSTGSTGSTGSMLGGRRAPVSATALLGIVFAALLVGGGSYLFMPGETADDDVTDPRPSAGRIESASESLSSAKMLIGLMSGAVTGATGSITTVTGGAGDLFDAVDTAASASNQLVTALQNAPDLTTATKQVNDGSLAVSGALTQAKTLSTTVGQLDELISPLIDYLEKTHPAGSADALARLRTLRNSSKAISTQLQSLGRLQTQLATMRTALSRSAASADTAIASAQTAARQLQTGLTKLASARADTLSAAKKVTAGVKQLDGVLTSIGNNIDSAQANLTPPEENTESSSDTTESAAPAKTSPARVAERVSWAAITGAVVGALGLVVAVGVTARRRVVEKAAIAAE